PHRRALPQLLAVHPARRPVLDARLLAAVGRELNRAPARRVAQPDVAILVKGAMRPVGRERELELASAIGLAATTAAPAPPPPPAPPAASEPTRSAGPLYGPGLHPLAGVAVDATVL